MLLSQRPLTSSDVDRPVFAEPGETQGLEVATSLRRGRNCLLLGERGGGKTTTLHAVARHLQPAGLHTLVVPAQSIERGVDLLVAVARVYATTPRSGDAVADRSTGAVQAAMAERLRDFERQGSRDLGAARRILSSLNPGAFGAGADRADGPVVLIDDLDGRVGHEVFGQHRDEVWELPIVWAASGAANDTTLLAPPADVFWERVFRTPRLTPEQVGQLIERRLDQAGDEDQDKVSLLASKDRIIAELVHPTPRQVVAALAAAVDGSTKDVVPGNARRVGAADRAGGRTAGMLLYELEVLGRPAHAGDEDLLRRLGISRARASQLLNALEGAGLVRSFDHGRRKLYEPVPLP